MSRLVVFSLCFSVLALLPAAVSGAELPPPPPGPTAAPPAAKPAADSDGFVPDRRPATMSSVEEGLPAGPLVAAAYGFIWAAVLVFVGLTASRTRKLETEIALLAERLGQTAGSGAS